MRACPPLPNTFTFRGRKTNADNVSVSGAGSVKSTLFPHADTEVVLPSLVSSSSHREQAALSHSLHHTFNSAGFIFCHFLIDFYRNNQWSCPLLVMTDKLRLQALPHWLHCPDSFLYTVDFFNFTSSQFSFRPNPFLAFKNVHPGSSADQLISAKERSSGREDLQVSEMCWCE